MILKYPINRRELDLLLNKKSIPNCYLFYGESSFYISQYGNRVSDILAPKDGQYRYFFSEYDFGSAKSIISQSSLFGDSSLLLLKLDKMIPKNELQELVKCAKKNAQNSLVIELYQNDSRAYKEYTKDCKLVESEFKNAQNGVSVRFYKPTPNESLKILKDRALELEIRAGEHVLNHLLIMHNSDIALAYSELDKLSLLKKELDTKDINSLCFGLGAVSVDEFLIKLANKEKIEDDLLKILEEGGDEIMILNSTTIFFSKLFMYYCYIKSNGYPNALDIVGINLPKHVNDKNAQLAIKFKEKHYLKILCLLQESSLEIKLNSKEKESIFLSTLIKLQEIIR